MKGEARSERWVAVEIVGDDAAAAVLVEALTAHQIPARLRRVPGTPYGPARLEIEVRVPADRHADAEAVLELLSEDAEAAARREARMVEGEPLDPPRRPRPRLDLTRDQQRRLWIFAVAAAVLLWRLFQHSPR
jgi:hypothetical protein